MDLKLEVILFGTGTEPIEAQQPFGVACCPALIEQFLAVLGIFEILVPVVAAGVGGDQLLAVVGVDPTVVSPGAIWWRDSRRYCLDCLMNSTRLKRRADQSSSIATWRTLSNPA